MAGGQEFDACEYSSSEFISRFSAEQCPFVALPVFPSRAFRHGFIAVNRKFVKTAKDLEGKRIGLPMYTMTASIFIKGLLQHDCGVDLSGVTWVQGQINGGQQHGDPRPCRSCSLSPSSRTNGASLSDLLEAGDLQAVVGTTMPKALGRNPDIVRLFPNFREAEKDYYKRTGSSRSCTRSSSARTSTRSIRSSRRALQARCVRRKTTRMPRCATSVRCVTCCRG